MMGYSKLESVAKQYSDIKLPTNAEEKGKFIAKEGAKIVKKIISAMDNVEAAKRELEDSKYIEGDWTGEIPLVKYFTGGKSKEEKQNEALRRVETLHLKATGQLAQIQQETINYITKSLEFSIVINAFLGTVITDGFIKKDGQTIKLTEEQIKIIKDMSKSVEAFINKHAETDEKFKEVRDAIWKNEKNILENKNRFSEIEQKINEHENEIARAFQEIGEHINSEVDSLKQTITKHNDKAEQKFQEAHQQIDSNAKLISNNADKINSLEQTIIAQRKAISELEELKAHKTRLYIISIISAIIAIASLALHFIEM